MEAEWIILADHVDSINNKLYMNGGGWETLTVAQLPALHNLAIAVAFSVPWNETNQVHKFEVEIGNEDGKSLAKIEGQMEVGRPAGIPIGNAQRVQAAFNLGITFEQLGSYFVAARIEGRESNRVHFNVVAGGPLVMVGGPLPSQPGS